MIAKVLQSGTRFFSVNNFVHNFGTLARNEFKFCSLSCTLSLLITNTPGTSKVQGSNLARTGFFQTVIDTVQKKFGLLFVCSCFIDLVATSESCLF